MRIFLLLALIAFNQYVLSQSIDSTLVKFKEYHQQTPFEKAYLHTDKEIYSYGETLWFSAYLLDASAHTYSILSSLLYVELIGPDSSVLSTLPVKISEGIGKGDFLLADSLKEGLYQIRAYTNYMQNFSPNYFFSKPVKLLDLSRETVDSTGIDTNSKIDFQLFPEGGELVAGQINYVAFRATDDKGIEINISGEIIDNGGTRITGFESQHRGMGKFQFTPLSNTGYEAVFTYGGKEYSFSFPQTRKEGYMLNIRQNSHKTYVTVKGSDGISFDDCFVVGHVRGNIVVALKAVPGKPFIHGALSNDKIPSGIIHFTFFKTGLPLLERLVYNENGLEKMEVELSKPESISTRKEVQFDLLINNQDAALNGNISVSVQKSNVAPNHFTIRNYLLLTSDLSGSVHRPDYYFTLEENEKREALDLLMMTHGWRRFKWENVLNDQYPPISYYPEKGFSIEGRVVKYINRNKGQKSNVHLTFMENITFKQELNTLEDGTFWFDGLQIEDTVTTLIETRNVQEKSNRKRNKKNSEETERDKSTYIILEERISPEISSMSIDPFNEKESYRDYLDDVLDLQQIAASFDEKTIILDEIQVESVQPDRNQPYQRDNMLYGTPDKRIISESIPNKESFTNIYQLIQGRVPGVEVTGTYPNVSVLVRGGTARFILDGTPVESSLISSIHPSTIEFIDVVKGARAAIYGGAGSGVIALYTYDGDSKGNVVYDPAGFQTFRHNGFYPAKEFYVPKYDLMSNEEKIRPDQRTTQYWNPSVMIKDGKGSFSYFTSDDKGEFTMYLEGITSDGKIIKQQYSFEVK